jgi:O-acetyl-ADP-ribose deacetylase (regulator of RNase III)
MTPQLHLVDVSSEMVDAWRSAFSAYPEVRVVEASIVAVARGAVVSPANGYGDMGGGVDRVYRTHFGRDIERRVQAKIRETFGNYLPIGEAVLVETDSPVIPHLISAPTMFLPEPTTAENVYLAMSAVLKLASSADPSIEAIFCPGMGTGVGRLPFTAAASAMARAYARHVVA